MKDFLDPKALTLLQFAKRTVNRSTWVGGNAHIRPGLDSNFQLERPGIEATISGRPRGAIC